MPSTFQSIVDAFGGTHNRQISCLRFIIIMNQIQSSLEGFKLSRMKSLDSFIIEETGRDDPVYRISVPGVTSPAGQQSRDNHAKIRPFDFCPGSTGQLKFGTLSQRDLACPDITINRRIKEKNSNRSINPDPKCRDRFPYVNPGTLVHPCFFLLFD